MQNTAHAKQNVCLLVTHFVYDIGFVSSLDMKYRLSRKYMDFHDWQQCQTDFLSSSEI